MQEMGDNRVRVRTRGQEISVLDKEIRDQGGEIIHQTQTDRTSPMEEARTNPMEEARHPLEIGSNSGIEASSLEEVIHLDNKGFGMLFYEDVVLFKD